MADQNDLTTNVNISNDDNTKLVTVTTDGAKERLDVDVKETQGVTVSEGKVSVGVASTAVKALNATRITLILVNDSAADIYIAKSGTAVVNEGIRLNKKGGSVVIKDYAGAVSAISTVAASNLTFSEVAT